jgi:molybdopterin-containing oxidoreductase family iron-sulfur binding subunit
MTVPPTTTRAENWKSPAARAGQREDPPLPGVNRRSFLEAAGFATSLAALGGCQRAPPTVVPALANETDNVRPGRARSFATTCGGCAAGCGMLATVRDGRPLKLEGMPEHPLSRGGLCAVGQAQVMELYDKERLGGPLVAGKAATWSEVDARIAAELEKIAQSGGGVRVVTAPSSSPSLRRAIAEFLKGFADGRHVEVDPVSVSAILDAHAQTHGARRLPRYRFDKADVIVSFEADFLGTWISPVEFAAGWKAGRTLPHREAAHEHGSDAAHANTEHALAKAEPANPEMSHHVQFESRMTLTGSNADVRHRLHPGEMGLLLSHLLHRVAHLAGKNGSPAPLAASSIPAAALDALAARLWESRGKALVVCGANDVPTQTLVNHLNHLLDAYGNTLDLDRPSQQLRGDDRQTATLVEELAAGKAAGLFVADVDLVHDLPGGATIAKALSRVPLVVSLSSRIDDTAALARFVCPDPHPLASWGDSEPVAGLFSLRQPMMQPIGNARTAIESFGTWSGTAGTALSLVRATWKDIVFPRQTKQSDFARFWDRAVHDGFVEVDAGVEKAVYRGFNPQHVAATAPVEGLAVVLHPQIAIPGGRHAHNPWLQELPDPITKITWDNCVTLSPKRARELGVADNDIVSLETDDGVALELPAFIQPGQHDDVAAIALGYGVRGTNRFARVGPQWLEGRSTVGENGLVGVNAAPLLRFADGVLRYVRDNVQIAKTGRRHVLATTQLHDHIEVPANVAPPGSGPRDIVQETTLDEYRANPTAGAPRAHHAVEGDLWPDDHSYDGRRWGMAIDLNACSGCSACLIACQAENNVPVVGRDEVARHREMHWIRIDRYYAGDDDDPTVVHQPMMCQHCANAPCETVCPVLATVHSSEGLNQQVYNRCVGTRYCANNCPYKVRRFNWFDYVHDDALANLALNPDVTVRMRGIMEKCSLCVQRIQEGKIEARRVGIPLADGAVRTACQQSCPTNAIVFGDLNDADSQVARAMRDARRYAMLEELNVRPSIGYLRKVRNATREERDV